MEEICRKLSIIVPQYNETEKDVEELFSILNLQQNVKKESFEVVLVNDHSDTIISDDFLAKFDKINIRKLRTPKNVGSGMCRQYGIDNSNSEYLMFIDADDIIVSCLTLAKIMSYLNGNENFDIINSVFLEEIVHEGQFEHSFANTNSVTWLHGKIYSRAFLEAKNIRFIKEIRVNEDSYFNSLAFNFASTIKNVNDTFVVWRNNKNSLSRINNGELLVTGYKDFILGKDLMLQKALQTVSFEKYLTMVAQTFIFLYLNSQIEKWDKFDLKEIKEENDFEIFKLYSKYKATLETLPSNIFNPVYQKLRMTFNGPDYREKVTIEQYYYFLSKRFEKND